MSKTESKKCLEDFKNISENLGFDSEKLAGKRRVSKLCDQRNAVITVLRELGYSWPEIGYCMNRDHTSIINLFRNREWKERQKENALVEDND